MNFYAFHINDFRGATWHLSNLARYVYRLLIDMYYDTEAALSKDLDVLAHKCSLKTDDEKQALQDVLKEFFTLKNGKWHHARIDKEIHAYRWAHRNENRNANSNDRNEIVTQRNASSNDDRNDTVTNSNADSNETVTQRNEPLSNAERQKRVRDEHKKLCAELSNLGISFDKSMSLTGLRSLLDKARNDLRNENRNANSNEIVTQRNAGSNDDRNDTVTNSNAEFYVEPVTINHKPISSSSTAREDFVMFATWQPESQDWARMVQRAMLPNWDLTTYGALLAEFVGYWQSRDDAKNQAGWEHKFLQSLIAAKNRGAFSVQPAINHAALPERKISATAQSAACLRAAKEAVLSGKVITPLPIGVFGAMTDGLLELLGCGLAYPPAADAWDVTLASWGKEFARLQLADDDTARVETAFANAKRNALAGEKRFPNVQEVLGCLPMRLRERIELKETPEAWAARRQAGLTQTSRILENLKGVRHAV